MKIARDIINKPENKVIGISIVFGLLFWVIDTYLDYITFYEGSFFDLLIFDVPAHEIYIRATVLTFFVLFGFIISKMLVSRTRAETQIHQQITALNAAANGVIITDISGKIQWVNPAFTAMTGFTSEDVIGQTPRILYSGKHDRSFYQELWDTILAGKVWQGEMINMRKNKSFYSEEMTITPVMDKQGKISSFIAIKQDITDRKMAEEILAQHSDGLEEIVKQRTQELRDIQEELIRNERLAALGELAGGVSHELRNPLASISNSVYYLKLQLVDADEKIKEYLDYISEGVNASEKIVSDLLDYGRIKPTDRGQTAISELVTNILERKTFPNNVTVKTKIESTTPKVYIDAAQISQVIDNLLTNACQALPEGGEINISSDVQNGFVRLTISDNGIGISEKNMKKVFNPLFTTKEGGTGLGLALSKRLIEANGGEIMVESKLGDGSTFSVSLPRAK